MISAINARPATRDVLRGGVFNTIISPSVVFVSCGSILRNGYATSLTASTVRAPHRRKAMSKAADRIEALEARATIARAALNRETDT